MQKSAKVRRKQAKQARHEAKRKEALAQQLRREVRHTHAPCHGIPCPSHRAHPRGSLHNGTRPAA